MNEIGDFGQFVFSHPQRNDAEPYVAQNDISWFPLIHSYSKFSILEVSIFRICFIYLNLFVIPIFAKKNKRNCDQ